MKKMAQYNEHGLLHHYQDIWLDLYELALTNPKIEHRLKLLDNEFIPLLKKKGLIFQKKC